MPTTRRKRPPPSRVGAGRENPVRWIVSRFFGENMIQTSAALAFTTLLSMVPLLTVVLSLAHLFPYADPLLLKLEEFAVVIDPARQAEIGVRIDIRPGDFGKGVVQLGHRTAIP